MKFLSTKLLDKKKIGVTAGTDYILKPNLYYLQYITSWFVDHYTPKEEL
jgi:hypothetical protein